MISVIVCSHNRSQALKRMLNSFFEQECVDKIDYELIILENNSVDDTRSIASNFIHLSGVRYLFEEKIGLSIARNRGIAECKGEIAAFLDDDVVVDANWLRCLQKCFEDTGADVVGGRRYLKFEKEEPIWLGPFFRICLSQVDLGDQRRVLPKEDGLFGLNLSVRKYVFELVGGFNEKLGRCGDQLIDGEESDLLRKLANLQIRIVYDPDVMVSHIIGSRPLEWDYFVAHSINKGAEDYGCQPVGESAPCAGV